MFSLSKKNEKGLSLIEASMVLALSAIVVSGVMFYYQSASDSNKTQNTISEVMSTVAAINGLFVGQSSYDGLNTAVLAHSSAIPVTYKSSDGNSITNPFGGNVTITAGTNRYGITLDKIPTSACLNLASMNLGTSLYGVAVNATSNISDLVGGSVTNTPTGGADASYSRGTLYSTITPVGASSMCDGSQGNDNNTITFVMQ